MQVALVQFAAGDDAPANLKRIRELVESLGATPDLVVCPEAAMHTFGRGTESLADVAEPLDGPFVSGLRELAADTGSTVVAGMFERAPARAGGDRRAYNTVVAVDRGGLVGCYRKLHLFDALGWRESERLVPGALDAEALLTFPVGDLVVGVLTCYDLRFPELARALVDAGATALALPAAWVAGPLKEDQWLTLARARAIENTVWVFGADQCAPDYAGRSVVVDPAGVPVAQLGDGAGVAVAEVAGQRVADVRRTMPSLQHRRFGVAPLR